MRDGQAGLGHPPWRGGGWGGGPLEACLQVKGSERPEAGCLGEFYQRPLDRTDHKNLARRRAEG